MRSTFAILICCLYALSAVEATSSSKSGSAEVQQSNDKPAKPLNLWSNDKSDVDDKDDKWSKDDCASRSVSILIGTSTYAIPCLQGDSIVNLNGLIPTPEASSSAVSSSSASSSEASSATDSTTTTTDTTATTTDTTTTDSTTTTTASTTSTDTTTTTTTTTLPTGTNLIFYESLDCTGDIILSNSGQGCFNDNLAVGLLFSARSSANTTVDVEFFDNENCTGNLLGREVIPPGNSSQGANDDKDNKDDNDMCASRSVSVLIGTSTYAIPCLQGNSIVNLNRLIPTPIVTSSIASSSATEASSSAVSSSAVESSSAVDSSSSAASSSTSSSSEASSYTYSTITTTASTTTATDTTTTTTDTTTATDSTTPTTDTTTTTDVPPDNFTVYIYNSPDCTQEIITLSDNTGCFNKDITQTILSAGTISNAPIEIIFYSATNCAGVPLSGTAITAPLCGRNIDIGNTHILSYSVKYSHNVTAYF
ncbi:unnamed protein product [Umbelopsis ramanniana]